jgi:SAM-dependent methyltransferase
LDKPRFDAAYDRFIVETPSVESREYYVRYKPRYRRSLAMLCEQPLPHPANILEIGGGQIAMLMHLLFGDHATVADLDESHRDGIVEKGIEFRQCDLLHDDLPERGCYDAVVLCEVIEHMPVPPYQVLGKVWQWLRPGGLLFLTTPNLYRVRNLARMMAGMRVLDPFLIPDRGQPIGHPLEYGPAHLRWHLETAGFGDVKVKLRQLDNAGATPQSRVARVLSSPLMLRPLWRDKLVAFARRRETNGASDKACDPLKANGDWLNKQPAGLSNERYSETHDAG